MAQCVILELWDQRLKRILTGRINSCFTIAFLNQSGRKNKEEVLLVCIEIAKSVINVTCMLCISVPVDNPRFRLIIPS